MEEKGVWRTVGGRRIFIKEGQSLTEAMRDSGKFKITTNAIEDKTIYDKKYYEKQMKKLESDEYEDGTYDLDKLKQVEYDYGYQVTFSQIGDNYSNVEFNDRVSEFVDISSDGKVSAGKFQSTPEISFNVKSKEEAIRLAKKYNQISIWDWKNGDTIETGGTGKR